MTRWILCLMLAATTGCGGKGEPAPIDAPSGAHDAPAVDAARDAAQGVCTGKLYDTCATAADCMSNNCKSFNAAGLQVCTQACSASVTCPMQNGVAVPCNNMGLCRPAVANTCP